MRGNRRIKEQDNAPMLSNLDVPANRLIRSFALLDPPHAITGRTIPPPATDRCFQGGKVKLIGKVALVTGASRGIGRGIAQVFAEEGADVAVNYIDPGERPEDVAAWVRGKGRRAMTVKADVANREEVEAMVE